MTRTIVKDNEALYEELQQFYGSTSFASGSQLTTRTHSEFFHCFYDHKINLTSDVVSS